jgi:oxygen-independent coproporphyrinogen-3 oxidase
MNTTLGRILDENRLEQARTYIEKYRQRRQSNKVLHGHPSPMFWLDRDVRVSEELTRLRLAHRAVPKRLNVYVGTPYCLPTDPDRCGFCLFPSEVYQNRQQLDTYLTYLQREAAMYRPWLEGREVANVYFGGGTSNLYRAEQYHRLVGVVRDLFGRLTPAVEITLEGIPQLFTREKLLAMKAAGVNRVSMGVQQLDDELIKLSGRKQKAAQVFETLESCQELGLPASVDLIFGWPRQTMGHMLSDLKRVVDTGVPHITHYELNVAGRTDFARKRRDELPSVEDNLEMYRVGREFLLSQGYRQATAYDWELAEGAAAATYRYEEAWRSAFATTGGRELSGHDAVGLGFAGNSFYLGTADAPGLAFMNHTRVDGYFRRLDAGEFPVERGFHYTAKDLRLTVLFHMLQGMSVDLVEYRRLFSVDLVEEYPEIWQALLEHGWVTIDPERLALAGDGVFYTPLIQGLLAHERMEELRRWRPRAELVEVPA